MRRSEGILICALLLSLSVSVAEAATYYVATNGNDGNPGTLASPWRTIQKAANTAVAGDTVNVRGGTYAESVTINRSGTSTSPITFQRYQSETPVIDGPVGSNWGVTISGANIILDGFEIKDFSGPGGQGANIQLIFLENNNSSTIIRNNHIHHATGVDNPSGIKIGSSTDNYLGTVEIYNNIIHDNGVGSGSSVENQNAIVIFADSLTGSKSLTLNIHHNECYNQGSCWRWKHRAPGGTVNFIVEYNLAHDIVDASYTGNCIRTEQVFSIIRNNICYNQINPSEGGAIYVGADGAGGTGANSQIYNNCIYNYINGVTNDAAANNLLIRDNIFQTSTGSVFGFGFRVSIGQTVTGDNVTMNYNNYAGASIGREAGNNYGSTVLNLASLQLIGRELNGRSGASGFVNAAARDFHLTAGSANKGAGSNGKDIGCYPNGNEVIGPTGGGGGGGGGDTIPPDAPTNLRVS